MAQNKDHRRSTLIQHFGEDEKILGAVTPPIFQNSLFVFDTIDELSEAMREHPEGPPYHYSRTSNPTVDLVERKLAMLEGTDACKVTGSGMAALSIAVMSAVQQSSHIVAVDTGYGPLKSFVTGYLSKFGVTNTLVDGSEVSEIEAALRPETSVIYLESPSSMLFKMQDFEAIAKIAKARGITTICDNSYATPIFMTPHKLGIDIVCHSATKYLAGHSDMTAGVICSDRKRIDSILRHEIGLFGSILHPFQSWLLTRSLRTLELRMKRHEATANQVTVWLEQQKQVERVHHVSLPSYRQRKLFQKMMSGSAGLFSFEPKVQDGDKAKAFANALKVFQRGVSWGGYESLAVVAKLSPMAFKEPRWTIRLFCGLEDPEDIIADLDQAMKHLQ